MNRINQIKARNVRPVTTCEMALKEIEEKQSKQLAAQKHGKWYELGSAAA